MAPPPVPALPDAVSAPTPAPQASVEKGITGTTNFGGQLRVEENSNLDHARAFGIAGTVSWGEWERLAKTDPHIAMALSAVCDPIRDAQWRFAPAEDVPDGERHAEFLEWNFAEYLEPGFHEVLYQAARGALRSGFSLFERVYDVAPCPLLPSGEGFVLRKLAQRLPSSLPVNAWFEGKSLDLERIRQMGPRNDGSSTWATVELAASDVLLFSWEREGNNYQGVSAFRPVYYLARIRQMLAKLIGVSMQREGAGIPVVYAEDRQTQLSADDRQKLIEFLANLVMHEQASAVLPSGFKLDWVYSPGANKGHVVDTYNALGQVILQILGAQQMVLGVNESGSRSVGEVHAKAATTYVSKVCNFLEEVFNGVGRRAYTGIVKQLIDRNFGPQLAYPKLCIEPEKPQLDVGTMAAATKTFADAGVLTVTFADELVVRERLGLPSITEEERDEAMAEKQERVADMAPAEGPGEEDAAEDDAPESKPSPPSAPGKLAASAKRGPWVPSRPLRASEQGLEPQKLVDFIESAKVQFEREAKPVVVEMLVRAQPDITDAMADGDPSEVAGLQLDASRLAEVVGRYLERVRAEGGAQVRGELRRARASGRLSAADDREPPATPPGPAATPPPIVAETSKLVEAQKQALVRRMVSRLRGELETEAIDAVRTGADASEVTSRVVASQLDTGAFRSDAAVVTTRAWNLGRDEAARLVGASEVEYSAILDDATCGTCSEFDGRRAAIGSSEHDDMLPPNRDCDGRGNCRCLLVYVPGSGGTEGDE